MRLYVLDSKMVNGIVCNPDHAGRIRISDILVVGQEGLNVDDI